MTKEIPKEILLKEQVEVNVYNGWGETYKNFFPPGRYSLLEGLAIHNNGRHTEIFLIAAKDYDSWLPVWEWQLKEKQGIVTFIFE